MGVLADIFSYGNGLKRKVSNVLADPAGAIDLGVRRFGEDNNALLNLMSNAYPMAGDRTVLNSPDQISGMRSKLADLATQQAMAGMVNYRGLHTAPMKGSGAPLHDLTQVYPDDIYSARASQFYGDGNPLLDRGTFRKVNAYKGNPDAPVTMYRAVPSDVPENAVINNGDWVTINPDYAKIHGEGPLGGNYRVLQQQVPARKLFTNGDSIHEFGYDESGKISPELLAAMGIGGGVALSNDDIRNKLMRLLGK